MGPGHQESAIPPAEATSLVSKTVKETARRWDQGSAIPPAGGRDVSSWRCKRGILEMGYITYLNLYRILLRWEMVIFNLYST